MLPQRLTHIVDVRWVPGEEPRLLLDLHVAALRAAGLQTDTLLESGPFKAAEGSQTLAALEAELGARGLPVAPEFKSGTTEAPIYQQAGMDTVVFGPGQAAGNIHRPNEHVPVADLYQCVEIYRGLILRLCG
jgi:acetylornithine deacetylase/succinyl-diaminopimelate desuccinylase-like protein